MLPLRNNTRHNLNMADISSQVINDEIKRVLCIRQHRYEDKATIENKRKSVHAAQVKFYRIILLKKNKF